MLGSELEQNRREHVPRDTSTHRHGHVPVAALMSRHQHGVDRLDEILESKVQALGEQAIHNAVALRLVAGLVAAIGQHQRRLHKCSKVNSMRVKLQSIQTSSVNGHCQRVRQHKPNLGTCFAPLAVSEANPPLPSGAKNRFFSASVRCARYTAASAASRSEWVRFVVVILCRQCVNAACAYACTRRGICTYGSSQKR